MNKRCGYSSVCFLLLELGAAGSAGAFAGCVCMCLDKLEISFSNFLTYFYWLSGNFTSRTLITLTSHPCGRTPKRRKTNHKSNLCCPYNLKFLKFYYFSELTFFWSYQKKFKKDISIKGIRCCTGAILTHQLLSRMTPYFLILFWIPNSVLFRPTLPMFLGRIFVRNSLLR